VILGRVVGQVWGTRRDARLGGAKLLVVRPLGAHAGGLPTRHLVAVDEVDAGVGDDVIVCLGRPARGPEDRPIDAAILGVVDRVDVDGRAASAPGVVGGIQRPIDLTWPEARA
jgi:ethanolamine utilization protein EutN